MMWLSSLLLFVVFTTSLKPGASLIDVTQTNKTSCYNFSTGNPEKKEFYTPNYPDKYPTNIKCIRRIKADPGHLVVLEFPDGFQLEDSATCEYDRLEVRDGPNSHSPLLVTFCGKESPSPLVSSGRYLRLQFVSDPVYVNKGFRAVYRFIKLPNPDEDVISDEEEQAF